MSKSDNEYPTKRQRLTDDMNEAGPSVHQLPLLHPMPTKTIFNLTIDCCDEIFDYLSVKDLYSFGSTCKAMQKVAGEYFKRNCNGAEKFTHADGIYSSYYNYEGVSEQHTWLSEFNRYITNISYFHDRDTRALRYIESHSDELVSVNSLYLVCTNVDKRNVQYFQKLLPKIEHITIHRCTAHANCYDELLQFCKNMTHFMILDDRDSIINRRENPWLLQRYPKLKHLHLTLQYVHNIPELVTFFKQNPNVQTFSTNFQFLFEHRDKFMNSEVEFETLSVMDFKPQIVKNMNEIFDLLKKLHEKRFFKRLQLSFEQISQHICDEMVLVPGLERLRFGEYTGIYSLQRLTNLKELHLPGGLKANDIEVLAINLTKLEQISIWSIKSNDLLPFMRHSKNLRKVYAYLNGGLILNLPKLNKEREKLVDARNVIIYVRDNIFLATKWKNHYGEMDLNLVEMRRITSLSGKEHQNPLLFNFRI